MAITITPGSYHPSQTPTQRDVQYTYDTMREWMRQVGNCPLLRGQLIENVKVDVFPQKIYHALGRRPVGVLPVTSNAIVMISVLTCDEASITIESSATATINLWVF